MAREGHGLAALYPEDRGIDKNIVYFDNLVIATKYIGPIAANGSRTRRKNGP